MRVQIAHVRRMVRLRPEELGPRRSESAVRDVLEVQYDVLGYRLTGNGLGEGESEGARQGRTVLVRAVIRASAVPVLCVVGVKG